MKIALATTEFVSENNFDGGLANYVYKLAKWLLANNHQVTVFLTSTNNEKTTYENIPINKVAIPDLRWQYKYKFDKLGLKFLMNKKKYSSLEFEANALFINQAIESENIIQKFDIVHYPHISGLALYCPKNIPSLVRISSSTILCQQMGGYGNDNLTAQMQEKIEIQAMKKANAVFGPSKMVASITEKLINKEINIIETPYITPSVTFDDDIYNQTLKGKKYLLFFGSIGLIKGVGTIAEIIFDVLEQFPEIYFVFVGKKLENKINNTLIWDHLIEKSGSYKNRIIHFDSLRHEKLFPIIKHAECVVLPSRIDNFPNTCIEAMANGKIVIGTFGNGFEQLIEDNESGFLINVDNHKKLLEKINIVLTLSPDEKQKIETKAKKRADLLAPNIVLNQLLELYKNTISNFKN